MSDQRLITEILRYERGKLSYQTDVVVRENDLMIIVNGYRLASLACLDDQLTELGVGFLFSEGLIEDKINLRDYKLCDKGKRIEIEADISETELAEYLGSTQQTSGCGGGISGTHLPSGSNNFGELSIDLLSIPELMLSFQDLSHLFRETGGVHSAALMDKEGIAYFAEDIGRHNAVDKVIGAAILDDKDPADYSLLISGRISSEIARKAIRTNIGLILSQAAPTSGAISLAWSHGIYLIGFARGKRFNIYTGLNEIDPGAYE